MIGSPGIIGPPGMVGSPGMVGPPRIIENNLSQSLINSSTPLDDLSDIQSILRTVIRTQEREQALENIEENVSGVNDGEERNEVSADPVDDDEEQNDDNVSGVNNDVDDNEEQNEDNVSGVNNDVDDGEEQNEEESADPILENGPPEAELAVTFYRSVYANQIEQLISMGYSDENRILEALLVCHGDILSAIDWLR